MVVDNQSLYLPIRDDRQSSTASLVHDHGIFAEHRNSLCFIVDVRALLNKVSVDQGSCEAKCGECSVHDHSGIESISILVGYNESSGLSSSSAASSAR